MTAARRSPDSTSVLAIRLLGFMGVGLLLAAAISFVSARWELFGPGARLGVLLSASAALVVVTHHLRRLAPSTARSLDVLVAAMVPIDTAAVAVVTGGDWRMALVAAGPMAVVAGVGVQRRGMPGVADVAIVTGVVLAAAGIAAQHHVHAPVVLAAAAAVGAAFVDRAHVRPVIAAAAASGLAPVGRLFDEAVFTGMGTLRELGLIEPAELSLAVSAGLLSTAALAIAALRNRSFIAVWLAVAVVATTALELWAIAQPPAEIGVLAVAAVVALVEVADPRRRQLRPDLVELVESVNAAALGGLTALVSVAGWAAYVGDPIGLSETPLVAGVVAVGWLFGEVRRPEPWLPSAVGVAVCGVAGSYLVSESTLVLAVSMLAAGAGLTIIAREGHHLVGLVLLAAAPLLGAPGADDWVVASLASASLGAGVLAARRHGGDPAFVGVVLLNTLFHGLVVGVALSTAWAVVFAPVVVTTLWTLSGLMLRSINPPAAVVLRMLALFGPIIAVGLDRSAGVALASVLVALALVELVAEPSVERQLLGGATFAAAYLTCLLALQVTLLDLYLLPVLWLGVVAAVRGGVGSPQAVPIGLLGSVLVGVGGRVADGDSTHTALLGLITVAVAIWSARTGDRSTLLAACPLAVAVAAFDLLDRVVGVQGWGWLVIGGASAVAAAAVLERQDREPVLDTSVR